MKTVLKQALENLPQELLALPRFFKVRADKRPLTKGWSDPKNQKLYTEVEGYKGFDTAGHGVSPDYLFLDYDHIFINDEFVNDTAKQHFNRTLELLQTYCELSASKSGAHIIAKPTADKFGKVASGSNGKIEFGDGAFLEIFYGTGGRYCLFTGDVYRCDPKAPIAHGERVDALFQELLDTIAAHSKKPAKAKSSAKSDACAEPKAQAAQPALIYQSPDSPEYDQWRVTKMVEVIPVADLADTEWLSAITALKNLGYSYAEVDRLNQGGKHYDESENRQRWDSAEVWSKDTAIGTLSNLAIRYGYDPQATYHKFCQLHPEFQTKVIRKPQFNEDGELMTTDNRVRTRDKIKSCPVDLIVPDSFIFGYNGIIYVVPPKKEGGEPKYICASRTPIVPTKKYREPTKGTVEYEFAILVDGAWSTTEIEGRILADPKAFATALSGKGAIIKDNKLLTSFIADAIAFNHDLPKFKSFNQTGWIDDACEEFAYPNGNFIIRREGKNYERIFKPKGDREAWKQKFVEVTEQGGAIANAIIGAAAAAPLVKLIDGVPNLQVHVHGRKSIGKTPMLKFAVSMFGDPNMDALTHAFSATPKYRLETACAFSGLPLICEELESIGKTNPETLSCDIYNYFLGVGGQALKRNGTSREPKLFTGTRFTSGEHSLVQSCGNGGEFKRVLELRCSSLLDEEFASDLYGFCNRNHGLFGEQWIQYIIKNRDIISKNYNQALKTILDTQRGKGGDENDITQLRTLVISVIAYQHFKICIGLQSLDTEDDANRMNREVGADLTAIIRMLPTVAEIDDTKRAIDFLKSFIAGSEKYFWRTIRDPDTGRKRDICHYTADGYGKLFENGEVAILPHALKMILEDKGHFKSAEKLIAEFSDKSYLCSMNGSYRYSSWIDGKTRKTIRFKAGILCGEERNEEQEMPLEENCASQ